jgi:hypothetical protein
MNTIQSRHDNPAKAKSCEGDNNAVEPSRQALLESIEIQD